MLNFNQLISHMQVKSINFLLILSFLQQLKCGVPTILSQYLNFFTVFFRGDSLKIIYNICSECGAGCKQCDNGTCTQCFDSMYLNNGVCVFCAEGEFYNPTLAICQGCQTSCNNQCGYQVN